MVTQAPVRDHSEERRGLEGEGDCSEERLRDVCANSGASV